MDVGTRSAKSFRANKADLTHLPVMILYYPKMETKIGADTYSYGLGGVRLQRLENDSWESVSFLSKAVTPKKVRYAHKEKKAQP